jgi:hypothetical protein
MGIDMHHAHGPVFALEGAQDGERHRVVAAQGQRPAIVAQDLVIGLLDDLDALLEIEGVDGDIADIGDGEAVEGRPWPCCRDGSGSSRPGSGATEAGARAVGGADVEGTPTAGVEPRRGQARQAHHGGGAAEARHLIAAEGLVMGLGHEGFSRFRAAD